MPYRSEVNKSCEVFMEKQLNSARAPNWDTTWFFIYPGARPLQYTHGHFIDGFSIK